VGYRHTKDEILEGAITAALDEGISQLTFGRLAKRLGISDRIVVYYFPTKDDLVNEVLGALGSQLEAALAAMIVAPCADHRDLVRVAWPILATSEVDPVFALFFEAAGLATAGREPYQSFVPQLMAGWIAWAADRIDGPPARRRVEAAAAIATIDGLLILRQLLGPDTANQAAKALRTLRSHG
jgi:AcrR family transcriptional regulator